MTNNVVQLVLTFIKVIVTFLDESPKKWFHLQVCFLIPLRGFVLSLANCWAIAIPISLQMTFLISENSLRDEI